MRSKTITVIASTFILFSLFLIAQRSMGQSSGDRLITQPVDESKLMTLKGNTYPLARAEFDRGAVPASLPMDRMLLVMKRSPAQESALETFLAQQVDESSPNYHKWLTPDQFGERFGASEDDIAQVTSWLQSHGFQLGTASHGRGVVEFSGNAGQVQAAFHTAIHYYNVNGQQHWANQSDPQIPAAFASAVAGFASLHNFPRHSASHSLGVVRRNMATAKSETIQPSFTFAGGCTQQNGPQNNDCFTLGPQDFATIYNVTPLYTAGIDGTGEVIAIVADSNINPTDVTQFRSIFGLPAKAPNIIVNGTDPGIQPCPDGSECEAILDVEWSGAVAKNATIDLVVSRDGATAGTDLSAQFIVDNNLAPIMSESFGECELFLGSGGNSFENSLFTQGAAEGITIAISTGDNGSVGCLLNSPNSDSPNTFGLGVNGIASTPFNVAVGGTDFNQINNTAAFWNSSNTSGTQGSAKGHIPETTWNDSCTNANLGSVFGFSSSAETNCNNPAIATVVPFEQLNGGSGGFSNCTTPANGAQETSQCAGGYAKPSWQVGPGVPADGKRDIPDVSLFASTGDMTGSFYIVCEADSQGGLPCSLTPDANGDFDFEGVGGTSVSVQVFAGLMALADQNAKGPLGNVNPKFYSLAASQAGQCATASPAASCAFYDISLGTIAQPCVTATNAVPSPNCTTTNNADAIGVLTGYNAGTGYDLATGLGSINATNMVQSFAGATGVSGFSVGPASGTASVAAGATATYPITVTGAFGFAGTVNFTCTGLPAGVTCSGTPAIVSAATPTASSTLTFTATSSANLIPRGPGANGISNHGAPFLTGLSQRVLASAFVITLILWGGVFLFASKNRMWKSTGVFAMVIFGALFVASCGGGGSGGGVTPPPASNTTTVVVTGTSGSATASTVVTLTVN
jgi:Pro-kumamolisin, activation domain